MWSLNGAEKRFLEVVGLLSALCLSLVFIRTLLTGRLHFIFVITNLALAWFAIIFSWLTVRELKTRRWLSWPVLTLTGLWLVFLPNTWYVLTDFIHINPSGDVSELFDIVLFSSLVLPAFILGFTSLYLIHRQLQKRLGDRNSWLIVIFLILLASFAIYLGRDLRWNTWDVIANPEGIIINVSDRVVDPLGHPRALNVTLLFFVLLSVIYWAFWLFMNPQTPKKSRK